MSLVDAHPSTEDEAVTALNGLSRLSINHLNGPSQFPQPYVRAPLVDTHTHTIIALHGRGNNGPEVRFSFPSNIFLHFFPQKGRNEIPFPFLPPLPLTLTHCFRAILILLTPRSLQKSSSRTEHRQGGILEKPYRHADGSFHHRRRVIRRCSRRTYRSGLMSTH